MGIVNKSFYAALAATNIKKNAKGYVPYMLTCMCSIMVFYIMAAIAYNPDVTKLLGGAALKTMLSFGCGVIGIFSGIFLFYTNSFLIKQRKKELALYNILGMAKRHVGRVFFVETLITSGISLFTGLLAGLVLGKLAFLAILKIMKVTLPMEYTFSAPAAVTTIILFGVIFFAVMLCNLGRIHLSNPMELLAASRQGEKEPKAKWILSIVGLLSMVIGYYVALSVTSPFQALFYFFIAVILVIVGTYLLFTAGSIALLKLLRKNKNYYYKTEHFTSVSGMMYRMKRNAAGLASICILSTMVLVTVATTVSMQVGVEDVINRNMPNDIQVRNWGYLDTEKQKQLHDQVTATLKQYKVDVRGMTEYSYFAISGQKKGDDLIPSAQVSMEDQMVRINVIPLAGSSMEPLYEPLAENEVIIGGDETIAAPKIKIGTLTFHVKNGSGFVSAPEMGAMTDTYYILVANDKVKKQIMKSENLTKSAEGYYIGVDTKEGLKDRDVQAAGALKKRMPDSVRIDEKTTGASNFYALYGGLLFVGIFLGLIFLVATVLIIYYKQITEGYEDSQRYQIMQKVGMSQKEVRTSIKSQILTVFFLPLVVAVIHVAGSFHMMSKLLIALQLNNIWLFVGCTAVTILIFAVIYVVVYSITAREYYKLVK